MMKTHLNAFNRAHSQPRRGIGTSWEKGEEGGFATVGRGSWFWSTWFGRWLMATAHCKGF